jgi:4a-hydroxytetrahydrobiopterin dehydratase
MTDTIAQELVRKKCAPCEGGVAPLTAEQIRPMLKGLQGWALEGKAIAKTFKFKNYFETMAFVNAIAWISHRENHHPDLEVGYNTCLVRYSTHAVGGLSGNDFICAQKVEQLLKL